MNRKLIMAMVFLAGTTAWGCAASGESEAEQKLEQSQATYVQCVAANRGSGGCEPAPRASQQSNDQNSAAAPGGALPLDPTSDPAWTQ